MEYFLYIMLGLLPSFIWLVFYLRKDKHPEPNSMVIKIFIWGMLLAPLAVIMEVILIWLLNPKVNPFTTINGYLTNGVLIIILSATIIPALVEEFLKYSIVKAKILKHSVFDEPTDAMLYCIISGLGFAAVENLMIVFKLPLYPMGTTLTTMFMRFIGATLVHALATGTTGYWLALGIMNIKKRKRFVLIGLSLAIIFHTCYNYLILRLPISPQSSLLFIALLIIFTALAVSYGFRKLKKYQSICI